MAKKKLLTKLSRAYLGILSTKDTTTTTNFIYKKGLLRGNKNKFGEKLDCLT